jgi:hypothetical protein
MVKCIIKSKDGRIEEWMKTVDNKGNLTWSGVDKKTGTKSKMFYERYCSVGMSLASLWFEQHGDSCSSSRYKIGDKHNQIVNEIVSAHFFRTILH